MKKFTIKGTKLYFGNNFENWILPHKVGKAPKYTKHILGKPMNDFEIQKEFSIEPFAPSEVLALLKKEISKQKKGEEGILLNNGYTNIFYVKLNNTRLVAVRVRWVADDLRWFCGAYNLDYVDWHEGFQVFARSSKSSSPQTLNPQEKGLLKRVEELENQMSSIRKLLNF